MTKLTRAEIRALELLLAWALSTDFEETDLLGSSGMRVTPKSVAKRRKNLAAASNAIKKLKKNNLTAPKKEEKEWNPKTLRNPLI